MSALPSIGKSAMSTAGRSSRYFRSGSMSRASVSMKTRNRCRSDKDRSFLFERISHQRTWLPVVEHTMAADDGRELWKLCHLESNRFVQAHEPMILEVRVGQHSLVAKLDDL